jgi:Protein of unknown function (DUF2958)
MKFLTKVLLKQLIENGKRQAENLNTDKSIDFRPVVKFFTPDGAATWLLTEIDISDNDSAFGLCDLGMGSPEIGYVSLSELQSVRGNLGLPVERDLWFTATKTLSEYADEARSAGRIQA